MRILALDTSTEACSAALWIDGQTLERFALTPQGHARHILAMVGEVLAEAGLGLSGLDALAFGRGPGSFTGVRIAAGVTQGLALGADLPVVPVSSLAALAQGTPGTWLIPALDARMHEVYWGAYRRDDAGLVQALVPERVSPPERLSLPPALHGGGPWVGVGSGWEVYGAVLRQVLGEALAECLSGRYPHAREVAVLGAEGLRRGLAVPAEQALPVYLRDDIVKSARG